MEGHQEGLGEKEGDADGGADIDAEAARDDEIGPPDADSGVGGHCRNTQGGDEGDGVSHRHDEQSPGEADLPEDPTEAQVHDHAEDFMELKSSHHVVRE